MAGVVTCHLRILCVVVFVVLDNTGAEDMRPGSPHQTSQFTSYEVSVPKRISRHRREQDGTVSEKVSYVIPAQGKEHVVILEKNEFLLPEDFTVYSYAKDGSLIIQRPNMKEHCHYRGYVEDVDGSSAALSLCSGLRGVIHIQNTSLGIEPLEGSSDNEHLVYRLEDFKAEPLTCGTPHSRHHGDRASPGHAHDITPGHLLRKKRAVLDQTHYVELMLVVDNDRFNYTNRNQTAVREEMVQLANYVDSMYIALNIRVVLVGLEIWSSVNMINTDGGAGEVLGRFTQWRQKELIHRRRHDTAQLILKKGFGSTGGMAYVGTACSRSHGGGINVFSNKNVAVFASVVAHELGHNLGMNHDNDGRNCKCGGNNAVCIMNSGASGSRNFSSCSADDFEKLILNSGGTCLLNVPRPDEAYSAPYCGNKLVDMGEECDCGSEEECEKDPCCEPKTCKLRAGAQCAYGVCCKHCRFLPGGTVCRSSTDECDLPEYCNGSSIICQADVFKQNGHPCHDNTSYCYNGVCQQYDRQCQALFGPTAKVAPEACFKDVNSKGDRFGNCGYQSYSLKKCESRNAMCGKLQCENVQNTVVFGIKPSIIQTPIGGTTCWGVDFRLGTDVPDPGMVNEGTKCGENKVCLNYECKSASELKYDCDVQNKCHAHGVCNSNRNCHCDYGWAPPFCENSGYGGSIDSGPTWNGMRESNETFIKPWTEDKAFFTGTKESNETFIKPWTEDKAFFTGTKESNETFIKEDEEFFTDKDTSVRDGLLVFFFFILPLLVLGLFVFFRRNELQQRFCRKKRSRDYGADNRQQTSNSRTSANQRGNSSSIVKDGVVHTSRTSSSAPPIATRPPRPAFSRPPPPPGQLLPQRPVPPPPV